MTENKSSLSVLKRLRAASDLSLRELQELSGVDQRTISRLENDKQTAQLNTLTKLAVTLNQVLKLKPNLDSEQIKLPVTVEDLLYLLDTKAADRGRASQVAQQAAKKGLAAVQV